MFITFDCYGTLIDWEGGITDAFRKWGERRGHPFSAQRVIEAYHFEEPRVEREGTLAYRDGLRQTAVRVLSRLGWDEDASGDFLVESFSDWIPFPDTNPALERLTARGIRLGILSNVDDDLLALTLRRFTVELDLLVTAQQVQSYKPNFAHFIEARTRIGDEPWLHAAQSYFHDIVPATRLGIRTAWINRKNESPSGRERPEMEVGNLSELVERVGG